MITKFKKIITGAILAVMLSLPISVPAIAHAATTPAVAPNTTSLCSGASLDLTGNTGCTTGNGAAVNTMVKTALNIFSAIVGIIAVIMIIIGGVKYITSGGSSEKTSSAKDTILFAIVGLVVVALAQVIVQFVLNKTAGL